MNKNDIKLIIVILVIVGILILIINLNKKEGDTVEVYYKDDLVLSADLSIDNIYTVEGLLGDVVIEIKDKKVRVVKEKTLRKIYVAKKDILVIVLNLLSAYLIKLLLR